MLKLPTVLYEGIIAHCQREYPKEACGILAGPQEGFATQVYPMTNVEQSPIGYSMDPKEQLQIEKQMRSRGQRMVGIYHSHTASDAYPSSVDVSLAISPEVLYVLVSLKNRQQPVVRNFRITGTTVQEEPVLMAQLPDAMADVRDMTCAQALAVVAKAVAGLANGEALRIRYNAGDVKQDLLVWAREGGHRVQEEPPDLLRLHRGSSA